MQKINVKINIFCARMSMKTKSKTQLHQAIAHRKHNTQQIQGFPLYSAVELLTPELIIFLWNKEKRSLNCIIVQATIIIIIIIKRSPVFTLLFLKKISQEKLNGYSSNKSILLSVVCLIFKSSKEFIVKVRIYDSIQSLGWLVNKLQIRSTLKFYKFFFLT